MTVLRPDRIRLPQSTPPTADDTPASAPARDDSSTVTDRLLAPLVRAGVTVADVRSHSLPRPEDAPRGHAPGANAQRILLIGTGLAVGWGVATHELALPGALARALSARTGRGCTVDVVADPEMAARGGLEALREAHAEHYDAFILMIGLQEAVCRTAPTDWARSLEELLGVAETRSAGVAPVFVAGIQPIRSIRVLEPWVASRIQAHADVLNETTRAHVDLHPTISYLPLDPPQFTSHESDGERYRSPEEYGAWARLLAGMMLPRLEEAPTTPMRVAPSDPLDEAKRQAAVDEVTQAGLSENSELSRLTSLARQAYGARSAMISVIDGDTQRYLTIDGEPVDEIPRADAFCSVTILGRGALLVPDALSDPRFRENTMVTGGSRIRFYAGHPVESPSGERIGALCVIDPEPRTEADPEADGFLRELTLLAQRELWKHLPAASSPVAPEVVSTPKPRPPRSPEAAPVHFLTGPYLTPLSRVVMEQRSRALPKRTIDIPRPRDEAHVRAGESGGHRILVIGNEYAVSWGVRSHTLGLPGQLANELSQRTGLGSEVDVVVDTGLSLQNLRESIAGRDIGAYDSVVILGGVGDAFRLLPRSRWKSDVEALLAEILAVTVEGTQITLCGIEPASSLSFCHARERGLADGWAETLNVISEAYCATQERVHYFAPVVPSVRALDPTDLLRYRAPNVYKAWAQRLSRHLIPLLHEPAVTTTAPAEGQQQSVARRLEALAALDILYTPPEARFTQVVRRARDLFLTEAAVFSLLSDRHQWNKAISGAAATEYPIENSFCAIALESAGPFIVEDAWQDPRIPFDTYVRFYAGVPISAPDGARIGALCVFDATPRDASTVDTRYLQELAAEIEEELRSRVTEADSSPVQEEIV